MTFVFYLFKEVKKYAVIVAGGSGARMKYDIPKQFVEVDGLPVIIYTLNIFALAIPDIEFIIVVNPKWIRMWNTICEKHSISNSYVTIEGGPKRFHSVKNGLSKITDANSLVAIHDAVRPLVSEKVIQICFKEAEIFGNAVPVIPIHDSVRKKTGNFNEAIDRNNLWIVQTPQCFQTSLIKKAYLQNYDEKFTDDALVLENNGTQIRLVAGNFENIKITKPSDILIVEAFLKNRQ